MQTLSASIRAASDSLTTDTWQQGAYFRAVGEKVCMCAHGAVQAIVNPIVAGIMLNWSPLASSAPAFTTRELAPVCDAYAAALLGCGARAAAAADADAAFARRAATVACGVGAAGVAAAASHAAEVLAASSHELVAGAADEAAARAFGYNAATASAAVLRAHAAAEAAGNAAPPEPLVAAEAWVRENTTPIVNEQILRNIWNSRPKWVSEQSKHGVRDAHYLLGLVGLTAMFNDALTTTLADVKAKFEEAAKLADLLEV